MPITTAAGIRHLYPRVPLAMKARAYVALTRPFTMSAVLVGVLVATSLSISTRHVESWAWVRANWLLLAHGTTTLVLAQAGSNLVNQAHDASEDRVNKPYRSIPLGLVSTDEALTLGHFLWIFAVLRAASLNVAFGVLVTLLILTSMAYSAPPLRLKRRPWWGNASIALARGVLGFAAAWTITSPWNATDPWVVGLILSLFLLGATTAKDYGDARGDRENGVRTLVVHYGPKRASWLSIGWVVTPLVTLPLAMTRGYARMPVLAYIVVVLAVVAFCGMLLSRARDRENRFLEGTTAWAMHYATLLVLMLALGANGFMGTH